jgi:predicted transposase/invertase (TIGR01784 family)
METPHDLLFKHTFCDPDHAEGELRSMLPPPLVAAIEWPTLRRCPGSFVDAELAEHHADLLFRASVAGGEAFVYLLLEHKSHRDPFTLLSLLRYMVRIWEQEHRARPGQRLPPIVPVVICHDPQGWRGTTRFLELIDVEDHDPAAARVLRRFVPDFELVLDDLSKVSEAELRQRALTAVARLVLTCFQRLGRDDDHVALRRLAVLMRDVLDSRSGGDALTAVMRYILTVTDVPASELSRLLTSAGPEIQETIMSTAERIAAAARTEGYQQGTIARRAEGKAEGQREPLRRQLQTRFGPIPATAAARVDRAGVHELCRWAERILTATTLEDVLGA